MAGKTIVAKLQLDLQQALAGVDNLEKELKDLGLDNNLEKGLLKQLQRVRTKGTSLLSNMFTMEDDSKELGKIMTGFEQLRGLVSAYGNELKNTKVGMKDLKLDDSIVAEWGELVAAVTKAQNAMREAADGAKAMKRQGASVKGLGVANAQATRSKVAKAMEQDAQSGDKELTNTKTILEQIQKERQEIYQEQLKSAGITEEEIRNYKQILDLMEQIEAAQKAGETQKASGLKRKMTAMSGGATKGMSDTQRQQYVAGEGERLQQGLQVQADFDKGTVSFQKFESAVSTGATQMITDMDKLGKELHDATTACNNFEKEITSGVTAGMKESAGDAEKLAVSLDSMGKEAKGAADGLGRIEKTEGFFSKLKSHISTVFDLASVFQYFQQAVRSATQTISELDAAFTEIAVVTDMTSEELWQSFDRYNDMAQQLGTTTKDAIKTSALYYQQGKPKPYLL